MDGFQSVLKCFLELQFGSAEFYTEPIKIILIYLAQNTASQTRSPSLQLQFYVTVGRAFGLL